MAEKKKNRRATTQNLLFVVVLCCAPRARLNLVGWQEIAEVDGEYIFRQFSQKQDKCFLIPLNAGYKTIEIDGPGLTSPDLSRIEFKKTPRPIHPIDRDVEWSAAESGFTTGR